MLVLALGVGAGCSLTSRETARQLDHHEVVVGGGIDLPGNETVPRISGYGKVGVGARADLGVQGGFAFATTHVGASARYYPTRWLTLSLQTEGIIVVDSHAVDFEDYAAGLVVTPRISTAVRGKMPLYVGVQANVLSGWQYLENSRETRFGYEGTFVGGFVGMEGTIISGLGAQMELIVLPLTLHEGGASLFFGGDVVIPVLQWSVGLNYRFGGASEAKGLEPSEAPPVQANSPVKPQSEPEPEPAPEYDKSEVPVY
ncbi:hypothetical protein EA187_08670 [Lujinxingia sediminis]|uniref:Outer membrane protein beta-barrel domain-containing protein n=1 Tax=Lujinxingia sediminis TaxID=2480984 RepID=A0ABY0CU78_9DELT|nr:hypothetical protein [Lujinxingia sediminis]RVU45822.1 hypothetical protein EA187_08670 [Lujinxingia sediminis]